MFTPTLRAFVEVDRATMGPERLATKLTAYAGLHSYAPTIPGRRPTFQPSDLPAAGAGGVAAALPALPAAAVHPRRHRPRPRGEPDQRLTPAARDLVPFLHEVPVLAAPLTDLFQHVPAERVWRPVQNPDSRVSWYQSWHG
ncbi:hypothetical protein [Streptomyces canus]|uniref:hypothetical protein n=1 Tax=Streptomyces canus TaxID=58343 RepID=UPI0032474828